MLYGSGKRSSRLGTPSYVYGLAECCRLIVLLACSFSPPRPPALARQSDKRPSQAEDLARVASSTIASMLAWPSAIISPSSSIAKRMTRTDGWSTRGLVSSRCFRMASSSAGRATSYSPSNRSPVVGAERISSKRISRFAFGTASRPSGGSRISPTRLRRAATCSAQ